MGASQLTSSIVLPRRRSRKCDETVPKSDSVGWSRVGLQTVASTDLCNTWLYVVHCSSKALWDWLRTAAVLASDVM
jgi:hypothetical protein